eukprot:scaffold870_cov268-Pinguiococcus_pyrenoidosus.AAC.41
MQFGANLELHMLGRPAPPPPPVRAPSRFRSSGDRGYQPYVKPRRPTSATSFSTRHMTLAISARTSSGSVSGVLRNRRMIQDWRRLRSSSRRLTCGDVGT